MSLLPGRPLRAVHRRGGWILGNEIDGTQAEYVRVLFADTSTYPVPDGVSDEELLMVADILPTGYEVGVLNGRVQPGDVVAVAGAGPVGLSAISGARLFSPSLVVAIDVAPARLEAAKQFGADVMVNNAEQDTITAVRELTAGARYRPAPAPVLNDCRPAVQSRSASAGSARSNARNRRRVRVSLGTPVALTSRLRWAHEPRSS
jgi:threonine dehydrogenase-like Zn-dependent dehydrogenase